MIYVLFCAPTLRRVVAGRFGVAGLAALLGPSSSCIAVSNLGWTDNDEAATDQTSGDTSTNPDDDDASDDDDMLTGGDDDDDTGDDDDDTGDDDTDDDDTGDDDDGQQQQCDALDVLVVVDNATGESLVHRVGQGVPRLLDALRDEFDGSLDVHVGVTSTSFCVGSSSDATTNCVTESSDDHILEHYTPPTMAHNGENGGQGRLFQHAGRTYFSGPLADPELEPWFVDAITGLNTGCAVDVPTAAAAYALSPANDTTNGGFLRQGESVLLLIVVTDEPDKSPEAIADYVEIVEAARPDCPAGECIVAAGFVREECHPGPDTTLYDFLTSFGDDVIFGDSACDDGSCDLDTLLAPELTSAVAQACAR